MIEYVNDLSKITPLWQEAFGDSTEDIVFFLDNCVNKSCMAVYDRGKPVSMLFLVDCTVDNKKSKYIYAACTFKKYMGLGYMTNLLEFCGRKYNNLCLIPADEALVGFYEKRGFEKRLPLKALCFDETDEIKEYLFEGCALKKPFVLIYKGE